MYDIKTFTITIQKLCQLGNMHSNYLYFIMQTLLIYDFTSHISWLFKDTKFMKDNRLRYFISVKIQINFKFHNRDITFNPKYVQDPFIF